MWIFDSKFGKYPSRSGFRNERVRRRRNFPIYDVFRRNFCLLLALFALGTLTLPSGQCADNGLYDVQEVKPHIFVFVPDDIINQETDPQFNRAGTAGFIITPSEVIVINTTNSPFHGRDLLYEIRERTDAPVKYVIDTDPDGEHILGNEVFADEQATIISTEATRDAISRYAKNLVSRCNQDWRLKARLRGFHVTLPNRVFASEMSINLPGETVTMRTLGVSNPDMDAVVYIPQAKVLFLGDLFQNAYIPRIGSRNIHRWIKALRQVESWDVDTYVPGHGAPGGKKEVAEFRQFLEWLSGEVETRIKEGKSLDQIEKELLPLRNYHWHAPELAPAAVKDVYEQLTTQSPRQGISPPTPSKPRPTTAP